MFARINITTALFKILDVDLYKKELMFHPHIYVFNCFRHDLMT